VASPVVLHLTRPYANADEYLAREAWSIDTRSMLLLDQEELPPDTEIAFDVTLGDGSKPIRAEARVVEVVAPADGRPGGLRVRFRRYGAATRAFVERAVSSRWSIGEVRQSTPPPPAAQTAPASVPPPASVRPPASVPPPASARPASSPPAGRPSSRPAWEEDKTSRFTRPVALAAPMAQTPADFVTPANREALLDRLRKRTREGGGSGD
jgi:hypothetical protein